MLIDFIKKTAIIIWSIGTIILLCILINFAVDIPYHDAILLFSGSSYFWFDGQRIAYLSGLPLLIYIIIAILIIPFTRDHQLPKRLNTPSSILAFITITSLVLLSILSLLTYFYIIFLTPYKPCQAEEIRHYFVVDEKLCQHLPRNGYY